MDVASIGRVAESELGLQQAGVGLEDFLNIFLTQLNFQDPLEPVDNREFIAQLAQFSSLELDNQANENLEGLLEITAANQSLGLIGQVVQLDQAGQSPVVGTVTTIRFDGANPLITLRTAEGEFVQDISPAAVSLVRGASEADQGG